MSALDLRVKIKNKSIIVLRNGNFGIKIGNFILTDHNCYCISEDYHETLYSSISESLDIVEVHGIIHDNRGFSDLVKEVNSNRNGNNLEDRILFKNKL